MTVILDFKSSWDESTLFADLFRFSFGLNNVLAQTSVTIYLKVKTLKHIFLLKYCVLRWMGTLSWEAIPPFSFSNPFQSLSKCFPERVFPILEGLRPPVNPIGSLKGFSVCKMVAHHVSIHHVCNLVWISAYVFRIPKCYGIYKAHILNKRMFAWPTE